jgi:hypothetical protein
MIEEAFGLQGDHFLQQIRVGYDDKRLPEQIKPI